MRAAIIDPFLEPFIYGRNEDGCVQTLDKQPYQLRELGIGFVKDSLDYQYDLYTLILSLVKKDAAIKENFVQWLRTVYLQNKERKKMVFDRNQAISDGYAFNLNGVLRNFCGKIVERGVMVFDPRWFVEEKMVNLSATEKGAECGEGGQIFTFQTAVFFSKVIFGDLAFTKMLERLKDLSMRLSYIESGEQLLVRVVESLLGAYRIVLYSDISTSEIPFLHHMEAYALRNPVPELFLDFYLGLGDFLSGKFGFDPSPAFCEKILGSPALSLHSKSSALMLVFNSDVRVDGNLLVRFYIDVEKMDIGERRHVRYHLNRILINYEINDVKLTNCALKDFEALLSDGLGALIELKKKYTQRKAQQAKSAFFCLGELFKLLWKLIEASPSLFLEKEILPQFVAILNYNLKIVVGPRCSELKCPEGSLSLGFEPKEFLKRILMFYIALNRHSDDFLLAVISDTMYFNLSLFKRAHRICDTKFILGREELEEFDAMILKAEDLVSKNVDEELVVPEQFIDPVTCMPMRDPVRLRTSNAVVDKSTFDMLLMNSGIDPFNREPLTEDSCVPDSGLKGEIDEYWSKKN